MSYRNPPQADGPPGQSSQCCKVILLVSILFLVAANVLGQTGTYFNQRDDQYRLLGLKRAKEAYEVAKAELDRQQSLFDQKLTTQAALDAARSSMTDAEVNYQQSLLAVLFENQYVTVSSAVKYYAKDGTRHVRLTVANASQGGAEYQKLINIDDELFRSLQPNIVNNVYVSLLNDDNAIISMPFESKILQLVYGKPVSLDFQLLQDLDAATVSITYGSGSQRRMKLYLQKDVSQNRVEIQSEQFSQEVDLQSTATYDLGLELFSGTNNTFSLTVLQLPLQISRTFKDPSSGARLNQVRFTESTRSKSVSLEVTLPDRPGEAIHIDSPIEFYVVALPPGQSGLAPVLDARQLSPSVFDSLDVGFVRLELIPRGRGTLMVKSDQLYQSISLGETAAITMTLVNEGSDRLDNIEYRCDLPLNWQKQATPPSISELPVGGDTVVHFTFVPPEAVAPGRYDIRIRTSGQSNGQPIGDEDKSVTIEIKPSTNVLGTFVIVLLITALVAGIIVFGVKLSRK